MTDGPTFSSLPETTSMRPRPIVRRLARRRNQERLGTPTEQEIMDAISILKVGPITGFNLPLADPIYCEAERLLREYGV